MHPADRRESERIADLKVPPPVPRPDDGTLARFMGGRPGAVVLKLAILSVVVGAILHVAGLSPVSLVMGVEALIRGVIGTGWDAVRSIAEFALYGAMVVVPVWLIARAVSARN